jgi:hypothetical protein
METLKKILDQSFFKEKIKIWHDIVVSTVVFLIPGLNE